MNEDVSDQDTLSQPELVRQIVKQMADEGYAPAVLVFVAADGRARTLCRAGLDVNALLRSALDAQGPTEIRH